MMTRAPEKLTSGHCNPVVTAPDKVTLAMAISNIGAACEQVAKGGYNKHFSYNFATAPDVVRAVKALMHQHHVIIIQNEIDCEMMNPEVLKCTYEFTVEHTVTGENRIIRSSGMAKVTGDKRGFNDRAIQAVATTTYKYMLIRLFNLVVDGVPDVDEQGEGKPKTLTKQESAGIFKCLGDELYKIKSLGDLQEWGDENGVTISTLPDEWQKVLRLRYAEKLHELKGDRPADSAGRPLTVVASPKSTLQPERKEGISQRALNSRVDRLRRAQAEGAFDPPVNDENPY